MQCISILFIHFIMLLRNYYKDICCYKYLNWSHFNRQTLGYIFCYLTRSSQNFLKVSIILYFRNANYVYRLNLQKLVTSCITLDFENDPSNELTFTKMTKPKKKKSKKQGKHSVTTTCWPQSPKKKAGMLILYNT